MKTILKTIVLILIGQLFICADGCDGEGEENVSRNREESEEERDKITDAFTKEYIQEVNLIAFGDLARLEFIEFTDYHKVFIDKGTASELKKQAGLMIRKLFISDECTFRFKTTSPQKSYTIRLSELLSKAFPNRKFPENQFQYHVWVQKELDRQNDTLYSGLLGFVADTVRIEKLTRKNNSNLGTAEFHAVKKQRIFGTDTLSIWTVFLGDISAP